MKPANAERHFKIRILRAHRTLTGLIRPHSGDIGREAAD
jgi:hypothetical protein